jgi:hypothetical protein
MNAVLSTRTQMNKHTSIHTHTCTHKKRNGRPTKYYREITEHMFFKFMNFSFQLVRTSLGSYLNESSVPNQLTGALSAGHHQEHAENDEHRRHRDFRSYAAIYKEIRMINMLKLEVCRLVQALCHLHNTDILSSSTFKPS